VTAEVENDAGTDEDSATETVDIDSGVSPPEVSVTKTANPTSVEAPGANVQFTIVVSNDGDDPFTLTSLIDSVFGDLAGDCAIVGDPIPAAQTATCVLNEFVGGSAGTQHANTVTASVTNSAGSANDSDGATVDIVADALLPVFTAGNPTPGPTTLSLGPGTVNGATFDVRVLVTGIQDFFGTGFRLTFDAASATFDTVISTGSVLLGATTRFQAFPVSTGVIDVVATREGSNIAGVDVVGTSLVVTLRFIAIAETSGPEPFAIVTPRQIQVCAQGGQQCSTLADGTVTWSGGSLVVN
jgi:uncharacterized repeat protein (TIGR01451 family)